MDSRPLTPADPNELLGYADPSERPEASGVEKRVLKAGNLFLVANRLGDIWPAGSRDLGLFLTDTRFLSAWKLHVQGGPPLCLSSQVSADYISQVDLTVTSLHTGDLLGKEPINYVHLRRDQLIDGLWIDRFVLTNFLGRPIEYWIELEWAADFADVFEIRGAHRQTRGRYYAPDVTGDRVTLRYLGLDGRTYFTTVRVRGAAPPGEGPTAPARLTELTGRGARIAFNLAPDEKTEVAFEVACDVGAPEVRQARPFPIMARETRRAYSRWAMSATRFSSSDDLLDRALEQGVADLKALQVEHFGTQVVSAGIPWYTCPFGRDSLITGFEALLVTPDVARDALRFLARLQGKAEDPSRDEQPGKIPHELRFGEMARAGEVPHTPYYGSVDATPLFLVLLSEYFLWTDDRETVESLLPAAEAALSWLERSADLDGDGLIEYQRRTPRGLRNQGWKDSGDGVPFASGRPAEPPIALVEVQGYVADARRRMAQLYRRLGREGEAALQSAASRDMVQRIEDRFWMEEKQAFAIALDREKRQVDAVTSNPGHLLFSRVLGDSRARQVVGSLLSRDMWSGWGIRTLAKGQPAFNPLSYHNGTVWPHDNALAAMGMSYAGMTEAAGQVFDGLWSAAQHFRDLRLPELFCGLDRGSGIFPVLYPVACVPQAWASAALFLLLRAVLGIFPDAPRRTLHIKSPKLPPGLDELTLSGMQVGPARATLRFTRGEHGAFVAVVRVENGPLHVRIDVRR